MGQVIPMPKRAKFNTIEIDGVALTERIYFQLVDEDCFYRESGRPTARLKGKLIGWVNLCTPTCRDSCHVHVLRVDGGELKRCDRWQEPVGDLPQIFLL